LSRLEDLIQLDILKTIHYRFFHKLGMDFTVYRNTAIKIKRGASITGPGALHVGYKWPAYCTYKTLLAVWNNGSLSVADRFVLYTGCRVVVDSNARLELGSGYINCHSVIACFNHIKIGHDVIVAENVTIRDSDNHAILGSSHPVSQSIIIGDHVWIGMNSTILKGVTIGSGSVIAAGSVVNKSIPAHVLAGGVPARVIKESIEWR